MDGCSARICLAASMPSVVWVGGILMSVRTASGWCSRTDLSSDWGSPTLSTSSISSTSASRAVMPSLTR